MDNNQQTATFAGGCFWCTEAIFQRLIGVKKVVSGYSGGKRENPTYQQVSTGATGHTEAIQITFDPHIISYQELVEIFLKTHDPTTLNQQGADIGTQYRSAIFFHDNPQYQIAKLVINQLTEQNYYPQPIVTELTPYQNFYPAESYHHNFYNNNRSSPYCTIVIDPKINKLLKQFQQKIVNDNK